MAFLDSSNSREERLNKIIEPGQTIARPIYNMIMGGVVVYGLIINLILCNIPAINNLAYGSNSIIFLIAYFALCFSGSAIARRSNNAILSFVGYNMVCCPMGVVVAALVEAYGGVDGEIVTQAFFITSLVVGVMVAAACLLPSLFEKLGGLLLTILISVVVAEVVLIFCGVEQIITSWIAAILFSSYIGFDFYRSQQFEPTVDNAVDCALDIYMDIINLFVRIMRLLGASKSKK